MALSSLGLEAGKTAEAQADLKRLEEALVISGSHVFLTLKGKEEARRGEAGQRGGPLAFDSLEYRTEAGKAVAEEDAKAVGKAALMKELKQAMGKEEKAPKSPKQ